LVLWFSSCRYGVELRVMFCGLLLHCYMSYRFEDSFRVESSWSCSKAVYKPVWHILLLSVQWINSWWWAEDLSETCRFSCGSKFGKMVHLVGFIIKTFVTMHGHTNEKFWQGLTNFRSCLMELFVRDRSVGKFKVSLFAFEQVPGFSPSTKSRPSQNDHVFYPENPGLFPRD
jgi:hypothetical protein